MTANKTNKPNDPAANAAAVSATSVASKLGSWILQAIERHHQRTASLRVYSAIRPNDSMTGLTRSAEVADAATRKQK